MDWCTYDPNYSGSGNAPGRWEHIQIIKVTDHDAPQIVSCPADFTVENYSASCGPVFVNLEIDATDCSNTLNFSYEN